MPAPEEEYVEPPRIKFLRRLVIFLTVALVMAVVITIIGVIVKVAGEEEAPPPVAFSADMGLRDGERIIGMETAGRRLFVHVAAEGGPGRIVVVDGMTGAVVGEILAGGE